MATSAPSVALFNTDPNIQAQAALLQQRQALAQALMAQGMKPVDTSNRTVGGVGYNISPFEGLGNMAEALAGYKMGQDNVQQQAGLAAQAYGNLLQRYQQGTPPQYDAGQVQGANAAGMDGDGMGPPDPQKMAAYLSGQTPATPGVTNPNNPLNIPPSILAQHDAGMMGDETFKTLTAPYAPTPATSAAIQGNMDVTGANRAAFAKSNTLPVKPGEPVFQFGADGRATLAAVAPNPGENMQFGVGPTGQVTASPVPGVPQARSDLSGATAGATAAATAPHQIIELWDPKQQKMVKVYAGNVLPPAPGPGTTPPAPAPVPASPSPAVPAPGAIKRGDPGTVVSPAEQQARDAASLQVMKDERAKPTNSAEDNAALDREIAAREARLRQYGAAAGASLGESDQLKDMQKRWTALQESNSQAQPTISYLQGIKQMAPTAATGQFADRLQFINSLLAPFSEKANDATTATNLLNKYSNQITARLGQGGLGTDAARSILQAAYPNSHMNVPAILEASDNLIGAQNMVMAKNNLLSSAGNGRDPVKYQQLEQKFDQAADPRIWQLQSMSGPDAQRFLSKMAPADQANLRQRVQTLKQMGVL